MPAKGLLAAVNHHPSAAVGAPKIQYYNWRLSLTHPMSCSWLQLKRQDKRKRTRENTLQAQGTSNWPTTELWNLVYFKLVLPSQKKKKKTKIRLGWILGKQKSILISVGNCLLWPHETPLIRLTPQLAGIFKNCTHYLLHITPEIIAQKGLTVRTVSSWEAHKYYLPLLTI